MVQLLASAGERVFEMAGSKGWFLKSPRSVVLRVCFECLTRPR